MSDEAAAGTTPTPSTPPAATPPPAAQTPAQTPASSSDTPPAQPTMAMTSPTPAIAAPTMPPVVLTPQKRGGILGVVDSVADALTGTTRPEMATDGQGNQYVKQQTMTRGQQWLRIAGELGAGAAKGFAAGRGNNPGAAAAAGVDEGEKIAATNKQDQAAMSDEARKQNLANANNQMLRQNMAEQAWRATRLQTEATQHDVEFSQGQEDRLTKDGGVLLGTAAHPGDIGNILKVNPDVMADMIKKHTIEILPHYNEDGTPGGIRVFKMPDSYRTTMLPAGSAFNTFDPTTGKMVEHHASDPLTAGERDDYNTQAMNTQMKFNSDKLEQNQKQAAIAASNATVSKTPSEIAKNRSQAAEADAAARKSDAEAKKLTAGDKNDPDIQSIGEAIAKGALTEDQVPGFNQKKLAIEAYLAEHHPNLDQKSVFMTGNERKQVDLATNAMHNLDTVGETLARRPDLIGKIYGRVSQGKEVLGTDDKDLATVMTALDNYALASTGAHGVRAVQARADAKRALINGFKNGTEGVAASVAAARGSLTNLASPGKPRGVDGNLYVYKQQTGPPAAGPAAAPGAGAPAKPAPPQGMASPVYFKASDGTTHWVPQANLARAQQIDPKLQVIP